MNLSCGDSSRPSFEFLLSQWGRAPRIVPGKLASILLQSRLEAIAVRVGIAVWKGRVSPVFDTAGQLLLVAFADDRETERRWEELSPSVPHQRARRVFELGVEVLICGAISRSLALALAALEVRVVPWKSGEVEDVLQAYRGGSLGDHRFSMPGCERRPRRGQGAKGQQ